jgi:hypothetical protein
MQRASTATSKHDNMHEWTWQERQNTIVIGTCGSSDGAGTENRRGENLADFSYEVWENNWSDLLIPIWRLRNYTGDVVTKKGNHIWKCSNWNPILD